MTEIITHLFEDSLFSEDIFMNTWSETNVEELNRSLERAMSPDSQEAERYGMDSPDSGVHVTNLEYDFNEALLGVDDPIFSDICSLPSGTAVEVIPAEHPVIMGDFTAVNESFDDNMEEEEEEARDTSSNYSDEENEENTSSNIPKNHPVEIHSYSVIKLKKEQSFKAKASSKAMTRSKTTSGSRKFKLGSSAAQKKQKLYEMEPLVDPVAEKNRLNALNAKKNRDKKKQQLAEAEQTIVELREENEELRAEAEEVRDELEEARRELAELRSQLKLSGGRHAALGKASAPISSA